MALRGLACFGGGSNGAKERRQMKPFLSAFIKDESGVTAMEYGMIASLVAIAIITTLGHVGEELNKTFTTIREALERANSKAP
jgi:pilus assembly protein Flp/PilA